MIHRESAEQIALMQWAALQPIQGADILAGSTVADYLIAIPNGGRRNAREAARMRREGVKAGVFDLFLPLARHECHGLWVEMKAPRPGASGATPLQRAWGLRMRQANYEAVVCYGADEAIQAIKRYLRQPLRGCRLRPMQKTVQELVDSVGLANAIEIVRRWGGRTLRVPVRVEHNDPLALTIGLVAARQLVATHAEQELVLPIERNALLDMRNQQIAEEVESGMSKQVVAQRYGLTRQGVNKVLRHYRRSAP